MESLKEYKKIQATLKPHLHPRLRSLGHASGQQEVCVWLAMYLKKVDGPRAVTLPDGTVMSRADLPDPNTRRWVASRKAAVVRALEFGLISREEAISRYGLSEEELDSWQSAVEKFGETALKTTTLQKFRQP